MQVNCFETVPENPSSISIETLSEIADIQLLKRKGIQYAVSELLEHGINMADMMMICTMMFEHNISEEQLRATIDRIRSTRKRISQIY